MGRKSTKQLHVHPHLALSGALGGCQEAPDPSTWILEWVHWPSSFAGKPSQKARVHTQAPMNGMRPSSVTSDSPCLTSVRSHNLNRSMQMMRLQVQEDEVPGAELQAAWRACGQSWKGLTAPQVEGGNCPGPLDPWHQPETQHPSEEEDCRTIQETRGGTGKKS